MDFKSIICGARIANPHQRVGGAVYSFAGIFIDLILLIANI